MNLYYGDHIDPTCILVSDHEYRNRYLLDFSGPRWIISRPFKTVCYHPASFTGFVHMKSDLTKLGPDFRYTCEQNEGMAGYGWDEYDVRTGGRQTIHDAGNNLDLQTEFVKVPGGTKGGGWAVRIKGIPREDAPPKLKTTVVFSAAMEGLGTLQVANEEDQLGYSDTLTLSGSSSELGQFKIDITQGPHSNSHPIHSHPSHAGKPLDRTFVHSFQLPEVALWQSKGGCLFGSILSKSY